MAKDGKSGLLKNRDLQIAVVLFILAFAVRYHFRAAGLFHTDSVIEAEAAVNTLAEGRLNYLQGALGYPGAAILNTMVYAVFRLFGAADADYSTIFSGVLFGALCIPMIYLLGRKMFDSEHVGVYAALMLTFLPVHLSMSTFGHGHGMELFFLLTTAYLAIRAGETNSLRLKVLAAATMGFTMAIRQTSVLALPAIIILYLDANKPVELRKKAGKLKIKFLRARGELVKDLAILIIPPFLIFYLAFVPKMISEPGFNLIQQFRDVSAETNQGFSLLSPMLILSLAWATVSMSPLGWLLAAAGIAFAWKADKPKAAALLVWFLCMFLYLGNIVSTSPRFVTPALAPLLIFAAVAVERIWLRYDYVPVAIVMIVLTGWMMSNIYPVLEYRSTYCGPCEFGKMIGNMTEKNAQIIGMDETRHYEHYGHRQGLGHPSGADLMDPQKLQDYLDGIEAKLRNGTPIYISMQGLGYDALPQGMFAYDDSKMALINKQSGKVYSNLIYNKDKNVLYDAQTNAIYPLGGIFSLEFFNRFTGKIVLMMEDEDWHHSDIESAKYQTFLYNITLRSAGNATAAPI